MHRNVKHLLLNLAPHLDTDYDYVLLIGVFEYGQAYIGGASPYEDFMKICNRHRKEEGALVIAIENKFGLKFNLAICIKILPLIISIIQHYIPDFFHTCLHMPSLLPLNLCVRYNLIQEVSRI